MFHFLDYIIIWNSVQKQTIIRVIRKFKHKIEHKLVNNSRNWVVSVSKRQSFSPKRNLTTLLGFLTISKNQREPLDLKNSLIGFDLKSHFRQRFFIFSLFTFHHLRVLWFVLWYELHHYRFAPLTLIQDVRMAILFHGMRAFSFALWY